MRSNVADLAREMMAGESREFTGEVFDDQQVSLCTPMHRRTDRATWGDAGVVLDPTVRVISKEEGVALLHRIAAFAAGGGETQITVRSSSVGQLRWARNRPTTSGVTMDRSVRIGRWINGQWSTTVTNRFDDASLAKAVKSTESRLRETSFAFVGAQSYVAPSLWSDTITTVSALDRSTTARDSVESIAAKQCLAAGYIETDIETWGIFNTSGLVAYSALTGGLFQISARNPDGKGAGWRGATEVDWSKLDVREITSKALESCLASANPRAVEPGRYTAILHQDVVAAFLCHISEAMDRERTEQNPDSPFGMTKGVSKIGMKVIDERLSLSSDPMDPFASFIPFDDDGYPMKPTTWIDKGVLKELSYDMNYAQEKLGVSSPLPYPLSCRLETHGPVVTIDEMIASTPRGIYVQRVGVSKTMDRESLQVQTTTLDGLWLVEQGKIKHAIKNMHILESPLFMLNRVLQVGPTQRAWGRRYVIPVDDIPAMVLHNGRVPIAVPALKVEDFHFAMLADAL